LCSSSNQFGLTFPVFTHYGVSLWVPEVGGRIDPGSEAHDMVMSIFGGMSKGERMRIQHRVRAAMAAQAAGEGRFLGGRPPYGYRLVDAGPHPNPAKAADGKRLRRLEADPAVAPVVQRIFTEFASGAGLHRIAADLNADGIPSPSGHDPARNRHRADGHGRWAKSAVRAILLNPRYTGRQVWNKQRRHEVLIDVEDVALGHEVKMRWNEADDWVWSNTVAHDPIITVEEFEAAQVAFGPKQTRVKRTAASGRIYVLTSLLRCGVCQRRMTAQWNHGRTYYRCRYRDQYAIGEADHPKSVYVKEDAIVPGLDRWLGSMFDEDHIDETCAALAAGQDDNPMPQAQQAELRRRLSDCDRRIEGYRKVLDEGGDAAIVAGWIADTDRERKSLAAQLGVDGPRAALSAGQGPA
jgi:DNA invertase Pin-like site-specific DNA recombinase